MAWEIAHKGSNFLPGRAECADSHRMLAGHFFFSVQPLVVQPSQKENFLLLAPGPMTSAPLLRTGEGLQADPFCHKQGVNGTDFGLCMICQVDISHSSPGWPEIEGLLSLKANVVGRVHTVVAPMSTPCLRALTNVLFLNLLQLRYMSSKVRKESNTKAICCKKKLFVFCTVLAMKLAFCSSLVGWQIGTNCQVSVKCLQSPSLSDLVIPYLKEKNQKCEHVAHGNVIHNTNY